MHEIILFTSPIRKSSNLPAYSAGRALRKWACTHFSLNANWHNLCWMKFGNICLVKLCVPLFSKLELLLLKIYTKGILMKIWKNKYRNAFLQHYLWWCKTEKILNWGLTELIAVPPHERTTNPKEWRTCIYPERKGPWNHRRETNS